MSKGKEKLEYKNELCLVMIVRDESHVIERCLNSVVNLIDSYVICDTGSEDDTPNIIQKFMKDHDKPGFIIYKEWKNFGFNKSYLLKMAYEENLSSGSKYLFWLDADEVYITDPKDYTSYPTEEDKIKLVNFLNSKKSGIFYLETHYGSLKYRRWNIIRNNQLYRWEAPVHEYLVPTTPTTSAFVGFITLLARKEGNRTKKGDSGRRDIEMFEEYLKEKPNDPRTYFYLAQTYEEAGEYDNAIEMYKKRMTLGGFYQEKYMAALRTGRILNSFKRYVQALEVWEEGRKIVPLRLEIPYEIMMLLKKQDKIDDAYFIGLEAYNKHKYTTSHLFIEEAIYTWKFFMEFSVVAYYSKNYDIAYEVGKRLSNEMKYPPVQGPVVEKNLMYFKQKVDIPESSSSTLMREFNFKPPAIVIIDNFLSNPDEVREYALNRHFATKGNYPGLRSDGFATLNHKLAFERIMGRKITYWPSQYNGSFQITTGKNKSWIHRDLTDYSAIIYLTPGGPPDGGTLVYRHKELKIERDSEGTPEQIKQMNTDSNDESKWDIVDTVGYKYNRLVIFTGRRSHKSNQYFGSTKEDGRLFQVFFFNLEESP